MQQRRVSNNTMKEKEIIDNIKKKVDKVFYSVPQPEKLKEEYEKTWQEVGNR